MSDCIEAVPDEWRQVVQAKQEEEARRMREEREHKERKREEEAACRRYPPCHPQNCSGVSRSHMCITHTHAAFCFVLRLMAGYMFVVMR